jgi:cytochrome P450
MVAKVERLIASFITRAVQNPSVEVVREFALPIQSIALTYLLNVPEEEAQIWIGWGTHVFRDGDSGSEKGAALEQYLQVRFDRALEGDGADFFSALTRATFRGRPLSREEMIGFANLTFAGGRDTIIQSIASIIAYLARNPAALEYLRDDAKRAVHAGEEFFRAFMPLTHIGRVCPVQTAVHGVTVPSGGRISLGWAAANYDPTVFEAPEEIRLDRQPNPHLSFGFGTHLCLGAPHARLIVRTLLKVLAEKVGSITTIHAEENIEVESSYRRVNGYRSLTVSLAAARP